MDIIIEGARENNLKNISLNIPKHKFNVITGVSGSGKSSLAFDTIYASSQKAFYDTMSTFALRSMPKINSPKVDRIINLSPCILIDQKRLGQNPRSTAGTVTEIYNYLRLLYSRVGLPIYDSEYFSYNNQKGACENCHGLGYELTVDLNKLIDYDKSLNEGAINHKTWKVGSRYFNIQKASGYFDMNKKVKNYNEEEIYNLLYKPSTLLSKKNSVSVDNYSHEGIITRIMKRAGDSRGLSINEYDKTFFIEKDCGVCSGSRLNQKAREVLVHGKSLVEVLKMELTDLYTFLSNLKDNTSLSITNKMLEDLKVLIDLGVGYLTLNRSITTLSNGESQKIKLSKAMNTSLNELIYIMDEPTIGLHAKDAEKVIHTIKKIVDKSNTAIIVEHNREVIEKSDNIIDIGLESGANGGNVVYNGSLKEFLRNEESITSRCLKERKRIKLDNKKIYSYYEVKNICIHNIKNESVKIPLNMLTVITGVSGSGKSSLIDYILDKDETIIKIGNENIGLNVRSNVATYTKVFDLIRNLFAKENNVPASLFSFNSKGACEKCHGLGYIVMDMHFLGDIKEECSECHGQKYKKEVLEYKYKNKNILEILNMTVEDAINFFDVKEIKERLEILDNVGLGYLELGQTLDTLSGGEVHRVNMAKYLNKKGNIYIFDEPTQGLHLRDIEVLKKILFNMIEKGNTIIVIEHNLDFIIDCDYIIDMGPDSGKNGGKIIFDGYISNILNENSYTAQSIKKYLSK